jgi:predicted metal-dependent hydrolase
VPYKAFNVNGIGTITIYKRKGNRSIRLTVGADGEVRISMPIWVPYSAGVAFASARRGWILAQNQHQVSGGQLRSGQRIGKAHQLLFRFSSAARTVKTSVRKTEVIITYGPQHTEADAAVQTAARAACIRALRIEASTLLLQRLRQLSVLHGLPYHSAAIKRLKSRWGSCDQHTNIVLNLYLVQLPWEYIDYVILHELAHTKVLHHGADFWKLLERLLPNARQLRKTMKTYRPTLLLAA